MKITKETLMKIIKEELTETWNDRSEVPAEEAGMSQHLRSQPDRHMAKATALAPQVAALMVSGGLGPWHGKGAEEVHEIIARHLAAAYKEATGQGDFAGPEQPQQGTEL